jgi:hypothetical protein
MKRILSLSLALVLIALMAGQDVFAQAPQLPTLRVPRFSQGARITQVIGLSDVTIQFHRPGVKGRQIWGKLLPYGEVWRAGANEPTLMTFSDEVTIEGRKLPAGTYRFLAIPNQGDWTVIFNSEVKNWGTVYEAKYDTLKFAVKPETVPHEEWMSFSFHDLTPSSARLALTWEKVRISFKIEFNTIGKLQASVGTWQVLNGAARYAVTEKVYLNEAMGWVDRSIAIDKNATNMRTKAELLAAAGKFKEAAAMGEEALAVGKARDARYEASQQAKDLVRLVGEWKSK